MVVNSLTDYLTERRIFRDNPEAIIVGGLIEDAILHGKKEAKLSIFPTDFEHPYKFLQSSNPDRGFQVYGIEVKTSRSDHFLIAKDLSLIFRISDILKKYDVTVYIERGVSLVLNDLLLQRNRIYNPEKSRRA